MNNNTPLTYLERAQWIALAKRRALVCNKTSGKLGFVMGLTPNDTIFVATQPGGFGETCNPEDLIVIQNNDSEETVQQGLHLLVDGLLSRNGVALGVSKTPATDDRLNSGFVCLQELHVDIWVRQDKDPEMLVRYNGSRLKKDGTVGQKPATGIRSKDIQVINRAESLQAYLSMYDPMPGSIKSVCSDCSFVPFETDNL